MRLQALVVGMILAGTLVTVSNHTVSAEALQDTNTHNETTNTQTIRLITLTGQEQDHPRDAFSEWILNKTATKPKPKKKPTVVHTVKEGDTLSDIAQQHKTNWERIWHKNVKLSHPDELSLGDKLIIPASNEKLKERPLPAAQAAEPTAAYTQASSTYTATAAVQAASTGPSTAAGNLYTPGNCTWYVKNKRPDMPNNLGNADTWVSRAAAQGMATGAAPRTGAVGQRGMHVVYVESVNADGTVTISEMNHKGLWVVTTRTVPANYFSYIY